MKSGNRKQPQHSAMTERSIHARILSMQREAPCLDTVQLDKMERSFRDWAYESRRQDVRLSRWRILLIFLLIRYTGAKLNEVLTLNPFRDIDFKKHIAFLGKRGEAGGRLPREVQIPVTLCEELKTALDDPLRNMWPICFKWTPAMFGANSMSGHLTADSPLPPVLPI
jgi:hypothetical protein